MNFVFGRVQLLNETFCDIGTSSESHGKVKLYTSNILFSSIFLSKIERRIYIHGP